jgi:outer membrane protein TolC
MRGSFLLIIFIYSFQSYAQKVLSLNNFLEQVEKYHPVAKQADFKIKQSEAELMAAKGAFDPIFYQSNASKTLDGKSYYNYTNPELKVQTPYAVALKTGVENSQGNFINPEATRGVLSYAGLELPVLKGLLIDYQRANLKQAAIFIEQTQELKRSMLNDLYLDAISAYWYWVGQYRIFTVFDQSYQNAQERFKLINLAFQNGERAAADTLEAYVQVQTIELTRLESLMKWQAAEVYLAQFLWDSNNQPYLLEGNYLPDLSAFENLLPLYQQDEIIKEARENHPDLRQYYFKMQDLEIERRLKFQSMLPELNIKWNALSQRVFQFDVGSSLLFNNNYNFGFDLKVPLLFREGRGNYQKTVFKIKETQSMFDLKIWEIENKIRQYTIEVSNLQQQLKGAENLVTGYNKLLQIEEFRLKQGESSLFLINSRENKLLEGLTKLQELRIKYLQTWYKQRWAGGLLIQ